MEKSPFSCRYRQKSVTLQQDFALILVMKRILFICLGNICRSPAADGIMTHLVANSQADLAKIIRMSDYLRHHPGQKTVPDPYYGDTRDFEFALELLEDACEGLLDELVTSTSRK